MNSVAKKIVFVIVEGSSDDEALGAILTKIFNANEVYVEILHCDITTEKDVNPGNIIRKIVEPIKEYAVSRHYKQSYFARVIHLVDTDGAFVSDEHIKKDETAKKFIYTTEAIFAKNPQNAIDRNKQKRENLLKMSRTMSVWNIPYSVFYMSCNLEHVLFNQLNCTDQEKEQFSYRFAKKYKEDIPGFLSFVSESEFSVCNDYESSWEFIAEGSNSLNRFTNLGLCFRNNCEE